MTVTINLESEYRTMSLQRTPFAICISTENIENSYPRLLEPTKGEPCHYQHVF